jgi:hypothetical protein
MAALKASNHGQRSASSSATPADILRLFSSEWNESPSRNEKSNSRASAAARVDFPEPQTPMTMTTRLMAFLQ